ncbi:MAG: DNA starvation/stationary phase protection protein [Waddliaceae bacterium]|nr:DNA starvation/stationary phase protection protein [Waddliaceae bacterium]
MNHCNDSAKKLEIIRDLSQLLSDTYVLYVKTQNFHWNVQGARFSQLHHLFQEQYEALSSAIDEIAERIRILDARPPSSIGEFLELTQIQENTKEIDATKMIDLLRIDHELIASSLREWIDRAGKLCDEGTCDLMVERLRDHEKTAWILRSH